MLYFQQPVWFLLLIPLLCALVTWRIPSRLLTGLRIAFLLLIVIAMCGPMLLFPTRSGTVVAVVDLSRSMPPQSRDESIGAINLVIEHAGIDDKIGVVSFGALSFPERIPGPKQSFSSFVSENSPDASDLHGALEQAFSLIPSGEKGRIVLFTDGRYTGENPINLASRLMQRGIAVDYRLLERTNVGDVAVAMLEAPQIVSPQEAFTISASVRVPITQKVRYELLRDTPTGSPVVIGSGEKEMTTGENRLVFRDRALKGGTLAYTLKINGELPDPIPENNSARRLVGIDGTKPLLVLAPKSESGSLNTILPQLLTDSGIETETADAESVGWSLPFLSGFSGIVVENLPAEKIGVHGMELIAEWVKQTGSGLMFGGGRSSYALGGYYKSPLDEIMPVSMELRQEHRKLSLAIVAVLDRSGSMAMPAGGSRTKMDLADIATADLLKLLTPLDEIGVLAVDSVPHTIVPLHPNNTPEQDRAKILRIQSMGGGIFVYTGLRAAVDMLRKSTVGTKHIILFADAADAEEPGEYVGLLAACEKAGITCSVIGLGHPTDVDANFLRDVAKRGKGQVYFTNEPTELPRFFAQDTFVIARSTFIEDPVAIRWTGGLMSLLGRRFDDPPSIGGYNLCYLKPGALLSSVSQDEYKSPILASWQAGLGRVLCYTGQIDGDYTGKIAKWDDYPSLLVSLGRYTAGKDNKLPNNMMLSQEIVDGSLRIRLDLDPEREEASLDTMPRITVLKQTANQPLETSEPAMRWLEPELLGATIPLTGSETVLATVSFREERGLRTEDGGGNVISVSLPPVCLPYSPEFRPVEPGKGRELLNQLAESTGGKERIEIAGIWKDIPKVPRYHDLSLWFILLAAGLFVSEIFERRTGWLSSWLKRFKLPKRQAKKATVATPRIAEPESKETGRQLSWLRQYLLARSRRKNETQLGVTTHPTLPEKKPEPEKTAAEKTGMLSALDRAKRSVDRKRKH